MLTVPEEVKRKVGSYLDFICSECGSVRMQTPSGTVCPNGHGRLFPKAAQVQLDTAWKYSLPVAVPLGRGKWRVNGVPAPCSMVRRGGGYRVRRGDRVSGILACAISKSGRSGVREFVEVGKDAGQ